MDIKHAAGIHPVEVSVSTYNLVKTAVLRSQKHFGFNTAILAYTGFIVGRNSQ